MTEQEEKKLFERLPQTIVPVHYNLTIQPFLETFKFNGTVIIDIQVWRDLIRVDVELTFSEVDQTSNGYGDIVRSRFRS